MTCNPRPATCDLQIRPAVRCIGSCLKHLVSHFMLCPEHTKRQVRFHKMHCFTIFITALCVIFLIKLRWPKDTSIFNMSLVIFRKFHSTRMKLPRALRGYFVEALHDMTERCTHKSWPTVHINSSSLPLKDFSSICQLIYFRPSSLVLHRWTSSMSWAFVSLNCPIFSYPSPHLLKYHRSRIFLVFR